MSGFRNSPYGKRLRPTTRVEDDDADTPRRVRQRTAPLFASGPPPTPALDYRTTPESGPDSPAPPPPPASAGRTQGADYGDRFVPSRDAGDMRTTFNLLGEGPSNAPPKSKIIPTESDAQKGPSSRHFRVM